MNARRVPRPVSRPPLTTTHLDVAIRDLQVECTLTHRFDNTGSSAIEAVYSFPVPLDAAFLSLRATLGCETREAVIQPACEATRTYDDAIAEGHSATLLTQPEPGVLCLSLGNLLPGESGEVVLRFATWLRVSAGEARFGLPMVHRPRYGRWRLEDIEAPTHDIAVEHPLTVAVRVTGLLADAPARCSSHGARFAKTGEALCISVDRAYLDRDLTLGFELTGTTCSQVRLIEDDGARWLWALLMPQPSPSPSPMAQRPLDLCLLLDGSGSMAGDAIRQSRAALLRVAESLQDGDRIQVLRFGSSSVPLFRRPLAVTSTTRKALQDLAGTVEADLGGTEMDEALLRAIGYFPKPDDARARALILVTDGAVQPQDVVRAIPAAAAAGLRIFVVAVGSAAGVEVLAPLAEGSGAMLERAVPTEPIDDNVIRQMQRARALKPVDVRLEWPGSALEAMAFPPTYPGEPITVAARFSGESRPSEPLRVTLDGIAHTLPLPAPVRDDALRALLGQRRYRLAAPEDRAALALQYGLLTPETSAVLVHLRSEEERSTELPEIAKIPQMVPAGQVTHSTNDYLAIPMFLRRQSPTPDAVSYVAMSIDTYDRSMPDPPGFGSNRFDEDPDLGVSASLPRNRKPPVHAAADTMREIAQKLLDLLRPLALSETPVATVRVRMIEALSQMTNADLADELGALMLPDDDTQTVALFIALHAALKAPALSDEEEALLAVRIATGPGSQGAGFNDSQVIELEALWRGWLDQGYPG